MNLTFHWINLLILFGALQGLIFGIVLLFNRKHPGARYLAIFMLILSYNGFETFNWSAGLDRYYIFFDLFSYISIFGLGPSLFLYIKSLLHPEEKLSVRILLTQYSLMIFHFSVRILLIGYHLLWINKIIEGTVTPSQLVGIELFYAEPISVAVFIVYLAFAVLEFRKHRSVPVKFISREGQQTVHRWIQALLICMIVLAVAWILTVIIPYVTSMDFDSHYYPIEIGLVFFIYWIAMTGYHKMKLIYRKPSLVSSVREEDSQRNFEKLRHAMETDKLYLDPDLTLAKVSRHTALHSKVISALLNQSHQTNFNDFINGYRVAEVKTKMIDHAYQHLTLMGIALESGFNSQATFQRAFRNISGMSPSEYQQQFVTAKSLQ